MTGTLHILEAGPAVTLQDLGRPGYLAQGLTRGGAMDRLALHEGAALLERPIAAAIEMMGYGGTFTVTEPTRIALTGAPMRATCDGEALAWNTSHLLPAGAKLVIGGVQAGAIGYLHVGGGFDSPEILGSQSTHLAAGLGPKLTAGVSLTLAKDPGNRTGWCLPQDTRFDGGPIGIVRTHQSHIFGEDTLARFAATAFTRDARANRQGIRMNPDGEGFAAEGGLSVVSEIISPGDIQITGDGAPFVLMCESQTTGGYPRIATVIPSDLPRVAQAPLGADIRFELLDTDAAIARERRAASEQKSLPARCQPRLRDPADMQDLLSYSLIDGVIDAHQDPFEGPNT